MLLLLACTSMKDSASKIQPFPDTEAADSETASTADSETTELAGCDLRRPKVVSINTRDNCLGGTCTWMIDATSHMGSVTLQIDQTGDPAGACGPAKGGLNRCSEWSETHRAFTENGRGSAGGYCAQQQAITLTVVEDFHDQVDSVSTLFDQELDEVTVLITVTDGKGDYAGCVVAGDEPRFFADQCTNVL